MLNGVQVELYFGGEEQLDSYSPRNELEALNSILQLVESSLSDACEITKNVLQDLRNLTIDKICQFAEENSLKTTIVEGQNSDKEKQLLQWGENNGVKTRLQIACKFYQGCGEFFFFPLLMRILLLIYFVLSFSFSLGY